MPSHPQTGLAAQADLAADEQESLREADAIIQQRHVPAEQVYDELMKDAQQEKSRGAAR